MRIVISVFAFLLLLVGTYYFLTGYRSAFEADQACHSQKWTDYADNIAFGCDHDLETKQWILFEEGKNHEPAKVITRFRY